MNYKSVIPPILREVRGILLPHYGNIEFTQKEGTPDNAAVNLLTGLDIKVEEFLQHKLVGVDSSISFVGEETGGDRTKERFWLADPIDGTSHFIRGLPFCTTMVALIEHGAVTLAAIYDFVNDILYFAEKGKGAMANGKPLQVSKRTLRQAYVAWETHVDKEENLRRFLLLRDKCILFKTVSSGFEHAMVAAGRLDARICFDPHGKDYDFAPGSLLVEEAGGVVANLGKTTYDYRNLDFIAANPTIFKELTEDPDAIFPIVK